MRKIDLTNFQVATSGTARQINRGIALSIIRRHEPLSRAELARRSGLQRSTISAIIGQLIDEGWVTEGASPTSARGRRPRFLHLNVERAGIVAVDLRPGTTRVASAGLDARFVMQTDWPTPSTPEGFAQRLAQTIEAFRSTHPEIVYEGVGISLPGRVAETGTLIFAPNLRWPAVNLRTLLAATVDLPVVLENAASACALAELWFGQHPDHIRHLVAVTIGEGVGVGLLLNGQLFHGGDALAGELGHVTVDEDGPPCPCGKRGCWEQYASSAAALAYYRQATDAPEVATFADLLRLAGEGGQRAGAALDRMAQQLGAGLAPLVTALAPQIVVIVGDVTAAWARVGPIVEDVVRRRSMSRVSTRIVPTDPATLPRLRGAVALIVQQHFGVGTVA